MAQTPQELVFQDKVLLGKILCRMDTTAALARCSGVSPRWNKVVSSKAVAELFARGNCPSLLGFITAYRYGYGDNLSPYTRLLLMPAGGVPGRVDHEVLRVQQVVGSVAGEVIVKVSGVDAGYYSTCPSVKPISYARVAPSIGGLPMTSRIGQFAIVPGVFGKGMAFFEEDQNGKYTSSYRGIRFKGNPAITLYVSVLDGDDWSRFSSPAMSSSTPWTIHPHPYCILKGNILFMAYIVVHLICFDTVKKDFWILLLPMNPVSSLEYHLCEHSSGILGYVHYYLGRIDTWVLREKNGSELHGWDRIHPFDLIRGLRGAVQDSMLAKMALPRMSVDDPYFEFCSAQIRSCSDGACEVLFSLGFDPGMFVADFVNGIVRQFEPDPDFFVRADGLLHAIMPLKEKWPPAIFRFVKK